MFKECGMSMQDNFYSIVNKRMRCGRTPLKEQKSEM